MSAARKKTVKKPAMRSFVRAKNTEPFFVFKATHQTIYWLILCCLVLALGIWVLTLNMKIQRIYDQIDQNSDLVIREVPTKK